MDVRLTVDRLAVGGNGIAREPDGRVVFVEGALPGETVLCRVVSRGKDFWRAQAVEVLDAWRRGVGAAVGSSSTRRHSRG